MQLQRICHLPPILRATGANTGLSILLLISENLRTGTAASDFRSLLFYKNLLTLIRRLCCLDHTHHASCYQHWISGYCITRLWFSLQYVKMFRLEKDSYYFHSGYHQSLSDTCTNIPQRRLLSAAHRCHRFCRGLDDKALWTKAKTCGRTNLTSGDKVNTPLCWSRASIIHRDW